MKLAQITNRSRSMCEFLNKNNLTNIGVEVGVKYAKNAASILKFWHGKTLHLVDTWPKLNIKQAAEERLQRYSGRYNIIHKKSENAVEIFEDNEIDFCHIDASHKYEDVKKDLYHWWPKVKKGGLFCGHDYTIDTEYSENLKWKHCGVKKAVDEFVKKYKLVLHTDLLVLDRKQKKKPNCWYIQK